MIENEPIKSLTELVKALDDGHEFEVLSNIIQDAHQYDKVNPQLVTLYNLQGFIADRRLRVKHVPLIKTCVTYKRPQDSIIKHFVYKEDKTSNQSKQRFQREMKNYQYSWAHLVNFETGVILDLYLPHKPVLDEENN